MVIIRLQGGLGNQLFQYALALHLQSEYSQEVYFELSFLEHTGGNWTKREFELHHFNCSIPIFNQKESKRIGLYYCINTINKTLNKIKRFVYGIKEVKEENYNEQPFNKKNKVFFINGYFQSESFFRKSRTIIREKLYITTLTPSKIDNSILDKIKTFNAVSVHFRRGDYISNTNASKVHGICDLFYYKKALDYIKSSIDNPFFVICSDDINWVKDNFDFSDNCYWSNGSMLDDLLLMTISKHNIIANSTFSWWGAWLNNNPSKIVISPKNWFSDLSFNKKNPNLTPPKWIRL